MGMADDLPEGLPLPPKDDLLDYARRAFAAADAAVTAIPDDAFAREIQHPAFGRDAFRVARAVVINLAHDNRHLGMIESLVGAMGLRGTATL